MALVALAAVGGILLIFFMLIDVFETMVLPRRITRRYRVARLAYLVSWWPWRFIARRLVIEEQRETFLSFYGPLSLIVLLATWAGGIIVGFATVQWAAGSAYVAPQGVRTYGVDLYVSATTFFTLGLGDVYPINPLARTLTVLEVANGYAVLAMVISYLPTFYQAFARREVAVSLLDARAGSPPSALELLRRTVTGSGEASLLQYLHDWELWAAELMESHLSYPMLAYFRSQHENQSWLATLTTILDTCALIIAGAPACSQRQAKLTFAMCRHVAVDLSQVLFQPPRPPLPDRLPPDTWETLCAWLDEDQMLPPDVAKFQAKLSHLRSMYEPYINALADLLMLQIPPWLPADQITENWLSTAWEPRPRIGSTLF
jgi:hypothetical protein